MNDLVRQALFDCMMCELCRMYERRDRDGQS
jgi:hypothetical protein